MDRNETLKNILLNFHNLKNNEIMIIKNFDDLQVQVAFNSFQNCYDKFFRVVNLDGNELKLVKL
jgi:hypothetical protein